MGSVMVVTTWEEEEVEYVSGQDEREELKF